MSAAAVPFTVLIPARLASTRLPNKPLADIGGIPMVVRVAQRVQSGVAPGTRVVVAGDSDAILKEIGANLIPNAHFVSAGIVAVNRAQEKGYSFALAT